VDEKKELLQNSFSLYYANQTTIVFNISGFYFMTSDSSLVTEASK